MAMIDTDFWRRVEKGVPGLFDVGAGLYGVRAGNKEAQQRLAATQDPYYQQAIGAAGTALTAAGNIDPRAAGAEWLRTQRGLLQPGDAADEAALLRMLNATGMLGAGSYGVQGPGAAAGVSQNPLAAAFYAQRANRDARMGAEAFDRGEAQIDRQLQRSGMLNRQAVERQRANVEAQKLIPSKTAQRTNILKGISSIAKDTGLFGDFGKFLIGGVKGLPGLFSNFWRTGGDDWGTTFDMGFY